MNYREAADKVSNYNRPLIRQALHDAGVRTIRVQYSGSGDDGGIQETKLSPRKGRETWHQELAAIELHLLQSRWNSNDYTTELAVVTLYNAMDTLLYDALEQIGANFNDDGCEGEFTLDLTTGDVTGTHGQYTTVTENENIEFKFA